MLTAVCILGGIGLGTVLSLALRAHAAPTGTTPPVAGALLTRQAAPSFTLIDQNGAQVSLASEKGHVVLLTFMDPQCTLLCPVMGKDIGAVERALPASLHPVLLIVSVAPARTRSDVEHFLATETPGWLPGWHWLLGPDDAALKVAWARWNIAVIPTANDITHDAILNVIDAQGYLRVSYPAPLPVSDVVSSITTVAHA